MIFAKVALGNLMVLQRLLELPWGKSDVFFCKKLPKKTAKLRLAFWKKTWPTSTQFFFWHVRIDNALCIYTRQC